MLNPLQKGSVCTMSLHLTQCVRGVPILSGATSMTIEGVLAHDGYFGGIFDDSFLLSATPAENNSYYT